jgi:hypothetical protein
VERFSPTRAALAGGAAGLLLGSVVYALEGSALAFAAVAVGVTIMLFVMLAFPEAVNRRLFVRRGPRTKPPATPRQAITRAVLFGVVLLGLTIWFRSLLLLLLTLGHFAFWSALLYFAYRRRSP